MNYKRNLKKKEYDAIDTSKRFIQWAHYQGGLPLLFIIFGFIMVLLYSVFYYLLSKDNLVILGLGILSVIVGLFIYYKENKK